MQGEEITRRLEDAGISYCIVGGLALRARGHSLRSAAREIPPVFWEYLTAAP